MSTLSGTCVVCDGCADVMLNARVGLKGLVPCTELGWCGLQAGVSLHVQGVEEVSTQNTVLNAKAVLKGLVKCTDRAVIQEVEVVAAKYDLATGLVKVVKKGWFSGKSFYYQ